MSYAQLKQLFDSTQKELAVTAENFQWTAKMSYAMWLRCTLGYVQNSTRLLALAGGMLPPDKTKLSNRFITHAAEEKNHDKLLVSDLKALGFQVEQLQPTFEMLSYSRSLYFWTSPAGNPLGLIGWVLSLEGLAANIGPTVYKKTTVAFGAKATSFLGVHAESDPDHLEKALQITQDLNASEFAIVADALLMYTYQYQQVLHSINLVKPLKISA